MQVNYPPKVLILESRLIVAADVALQLQKLGYELLGIHIHGEDALKTIEAKQPDIIVMNLGKDRIDTARLISKVFGIPLVFLSAYTDKAFLRHLIPLAPCALITKPFSAGDLQRGLQSTMDRMRVEGRWPYSDRDHLESAIIPLGYS